ncbi:ribonuclease D [Vibrio sp. TH_r3]|uniref:ribonuclease D n=1 Tax=Vibrio sp. TH_r3 TaxID=3082084 RepID=UPI002953FEBB|nr:ribonuclease D [Vibrio sp. TH_r3]MDV7104027.1 ribonuclease D [Vibrio sp. TH_r3]
MEYKIIDTTSALEAVCELASQADSVMLDTEFVRTRTYFPQLGLIQLYDGNNLSLIDPSCIDDMSSFEKLLKDASVLKVLHACGEDLEVFKQSFGCTPFPMIDTQIMAAFLGHGLLTGFASLVNQYLNIELDKSESRTDWLARPLTLRQLEYAAADVYYLLPLFNSLDQQIIESGWKEAAFQESELLIEKRCTVSNPESAYIDIKGAWQLTPKQLAVLKPLAIWRLQEALNKDISLNFVFKEQDLWTVAKLGIKSLRMMNEEGFDQRAIRRHGEKIIQIVKSAEQLSEDQWPEKIERLMDKPAYKQTFKVLKDHVKHVSQSTHLASEFLASKKQINQLISWAWKKNRDPEMLPDLMVGWRRDVLGEKLDTLLKG